MDQTFFWESFSKANWWLHEQSLSNDPTTCQHNQPLDINRKDQEELCTERHNNKGNIVNQFTLFNLYGYFPFFKNKNHFKHENEKIRLPSNALILLSVSTTTDNSSGPSVSSELLSSSSWIFGVEACKSRSLTVDAVSSKSSKSNWLSSSSSEALELGTDKLVANLAALSIWMLRLSASIIDLCTTSSSAKRSTSGAGTGAIPDGTLGCSVVINCV